MGRETFEFAGLRWDIERARGLVEGRSAASVRVAEAGALLWMIRVDEEWAIEHADLDRPLLLVPVPIGGHLVIDGWHRLYRARMEGRVRLPAVALTEDEERFVRLCGSWGEAAA